MQSLEEKLAILAAAARYDVSCSSSGSRRKNTGSSLGNASPAGICHSWADDGRCISLLKVLYTNRCTFNCRYCQNRAGADIPRASFTPDEIARLTAEFYRRNYIEGLFLSSAIAGSPDSTMEQLVTSVRLLRTRYQFTGYIHLKAIPGSDSRLLREAGLLADRVSLNIELPSVSALRLLAPQKTPVSLRRPMDCLRKMQQEYSEEKKTIRSTPVFLPAGQTTQMIVGASPDSDRDILDTGFGLYRQYGLKRVYYSAYIPVVSSPYLPDSAPPLLREHRLYQADWLLRFYGFTPEELIRPGENLSLKLDPKTQWAVSRASDFPVEINRAPPETLLRVPGIGPHSMRNIIQARRFGPLSYEGLKELGVVLKRACHFITVSGRYYGLHYSDPEVLRNYLSSPPPGQQMSLWDLASPSEREAIQPLNRSANLPLATGSP